MKKILYADGYMKIMINGKEFQASLSVLGIQLIDLDTGKNRLVKAKDVIKLLEQSATEISQEIQLENDPDLMKEIFGEEDE